MSHDYLDETQGTSEATAKSYATGFILAIILTVIPFAVVMFGGVSVGTAYTIIVVTAVIQVLVHLYYFLHLDVSAQHLATTMTGLFTALIMGILCGGTIWLFYNLMERTMAGAMSMPGM